MNISRRDMDEFVPRKLQGNQILGSIAGAMVGHVLGGGDKSSGSTTTQQTFANPFTSGGGLFGVNFGPGVVPGTMAAALANPEAVPEPTRQAPIRTESPVDILRRTHPSLFGNGRNPNANSVLGLRGSDRHGPNAFGNHGVIGRTAKRSKGGSGGSGGQMGLDMAITDPRLLAISQGGLQGAEQFLGNALTNPLADEASLIASRFMNELGATSPMDVALQQFGLLNPILQEEQERDALNLENRLFAQGRLGSTGGSQDFNALMDAQTDAERKLLFDSLGQGMATQAQNASLAATMAQLDPTLRQAQLGLAGGMLNIPLGIQSAMLQQAQVAGGLAGASQSGNITSPGIDVGQSIGAGLLNQGIQGITNAIPGLFSGGSSSFFNDPGFSGSTGFGPGSIFSGNGAL